MLICEKWVNLLNKKNFVAFTAVVLLIVLFQYRFNYFTTSSIYWPKNNKYVKRVVESVYNELPTKTSQKSISKRVAYSNKDPDANQVGQENEKCEESETAVLFLKTHKTGSSTITNILNRYADKNDLKVLLPEGQKYYSFDWPNKFRLNSAVNSFGRPNILANHARYSRKSMNVLFPRENTVYISILRHPVSQWESTFQYMSFPFILDIGQKNDPLDFFLKNPPTTETIIEIARRYPSLYLIRNPLFFDLGLDFKHYDNSTFIRRALKTLDNDFDLVLITEYFDESLTLLRRRLCWDIDDVVHFKMNERLNKNKRNILSEAHIQLIKTWNNADMVLYNYFLEKFWREVKNEGAGFHDDVIKLRKRREHYSKICIEKEAIEEAYSSVYVKGYQMRTNLTGDTKIKCQRMLKNEIHYLDYFRANRAKWIKKLEGISIQNFETSTEEVDIFVETPDINFSNYNYGIQKKKPTVRQKRINNFISQINPPVDDDNLLHRIEAEQKSETEGQLDAAFNSKSTVQNDVITPMHETENKGSYAKDNIKQVQQNLDSNSILSVSSPIREIGSSVTKHEETGDKDVQFIETKFDGKTISSSTDQAVL